MRTGIVWVVLIATAGVAHAEHLDPELLALCSSPDPGARSYCLHALRRGGDPDGEARQRVAEMADHDPSLRELASTTYTELYDTARAPTTPAPARFGGEPSRVIYAPTAFTRPASTASINAFELGTFTLDYGVTDSVSAGVQTAIPVGAFIVGPTIHAGMPIEGGAIGFYAHALLVAPFSGDKSVVLAGGGPMVTLGTTDRYFNFGVLGYFVKADGSFGAIVPHAGGSVRISRRVRLGAELYVPAAYGDSVSDSGFGKLAILLWGVRVFGDSLWGDIALADPICADCGEIYSTIPLGIPFLNFGASF